MISIFLRRARVPRMNAKEALRVQQQVAALQQAKSLRLQRVARKPKRKKRSARKESVW